MPAGDPEQPSREGEAPFREIANELPHIVWMHDASGEQELVNDTFCAFFGVTREQMRGARWQVLMHPDDAEGYTNEFLACVRDRRPFHAEVRVKRADGQWRWLESWGRPRFGPDGEYQGMLGTSADVTDRKRAEAALRESEERLRLAAEATGFGTYDFDVETGHATWSERLRQIIGIDGEGPFEPFVELAPRIHPEDRARYFANIERAFDPAGAGEHEIEYRIRRSDGEVRWLRDRGRILFRVTRGVRRPVRAVGTVLDITEHKRAVEQLRESDRRKDEYLAMLGHELRNPLAAIQHAAELVKLSESEDPRLRRASGVLERQSTHMARLIDGLLEVSRIARGKIDLTRATFDLREVCDAVLDDHSARLGALGLTLERRLPPAPVWIDGDRVRLAQVIDNLVSNAIKFTPAPGRIHVSLAIRGEQVELRVRDTGVGVRTSELQRIFEPFHQEAQDVARGSGGLGLGLALARELIELHEGSIEACSEGLNAGAEFVIRLPQSSAPSPRAPESALAVPARRILIVEDNPDAAEMLRDLLVLQGHQLSLATTGAEALALLRGDRADVVLCDIGLPGMSGYEFARAVRADPSLREVALVALTGYGQPEDRRRTHAAGFDEHLTKPVALEALGRVLARL